MEDFYYYVEGSAKSPTIDFNLNTGELILEGKSIPENAAKVYEPLLAMLEKYIQSPRKITNFRLNLQYFNSVSMLWFVRIIKTLARIDTEDSVIFTHLYLELEDFESFDSEEVTNILGSLVENIGPVKPSFAVKVHATQNGKLIRETTVLI